MSVKRKLTLSFMGISILVILMGSVGVINLYKVDNSLKNITEKNLPQKQLISESILLMEKSISDIKSYVLSYTKNDQIIQNVMNNLTTLEQNLQNIDTKDIELTKNLLLDTKNLKTVINELVTVHNQKLGLYFIFNSKLYNVETFFYHLRDDNQAEFSTWYETHSIKNKRIKKYIDQFSKAYDLKDINKQKKYSKKIIKTSSRTIAMIKNSEKINFDTLIESSKKIVISLNHIDKNIQKELKDSQNDIVSVISNGKLFNILLTVIALSIGMLISFFASRNIINALNQFQVGLEDFFLFLQNKKNNVEKINIGSKDEFGEMAQSLNENISISAKLHQEIYDLNHNLEQKIENRTEELQKKSNHIEQLLDNAEEGFLSFGKDLIVDSEYSKECVNIFNNVIDGQNILNLLFEKQKDQELFEKVIIDLFNPKLKERRKKVLIELLPKELHIHEKFIKIQYKVISEDTVMLILVDITEKKKLEEKIEEEKNILKMIVSVVSDIREFKEIANEYFVFCDSVKEYNLEEKTFLNDVVEYYRMIHTFKGNFAQKDLVYIVPKLHEYESKINAIVKDPNRKFNEFKELIKTSNIKDWIYEDIVVIDDVLDHKILDKDDTINVPISLICKIEEELKLILNYTNDQREIAYKKLLDDVLSMRKTSLYDMMKNYPKVVAQLSKRLDKKLYPMKIVGGESLFVNNNIAPFIKSLIHIFRNSVDHGIESLEERVVLNKNETATISCDIEYETDHIIINIIDDGKGIDTNIIKQKAIEKNIFTLEQLDMMQEKELLMILFSDTFSTKDHATEISGRGIGLGAVRGEIEKLKGEIEILTSISKGTTFKFIIPKESII